MPGPKIRLNLSTLGQLQQPLNPGIGWVGPERPAETWADVRADPLSALFDIGRGAITGDAPKGMNLQGLGSVLGAALPLVKPLRLAEGLSGESGYVYHATNAERLAEIAETGKLKTFKPSYGTDQASWPDYSTEKRAYFMASPERSLQFAPEDGTPVILRTKQGPHVVRESTGDLFIRKPIDAKAVEFLGEDNQWHPVSILKGTR